MMFDVGEMVYFGVDGGNIWDVDASGFEGNVVGVVRKGAVCLILECSPLGEYKVLTSDGVVGWVGEKWMFRVDE